MDNNQNPNNNPNNGDKNQPPKNRQTLLVLLIASVITMLLSFEMNIPE